MGAMERHILLTHEGQKDHICESCGIAFANEHGLRRHVAITHEGQRYQCEKCGKEFRTIKSHRMHIKNVHEGLGKKYPCNRCGEVFYTLLDIKRHKIAKHLDCVHCGKVFEGPNAVQTMRSHIRFVHKGEKKYTCHTCGKAFQSKTDMTRHVDSVHLKKPVWQNIKDKYKNYPGGKKPVVEKACEFCPETFTHSILLKKHLSANHRDLIKFTCRICPLTVGSKWCFISHMQKNHEHDSYQCKVCQQPFKLAFNQGIKGGDGHGSSTKTRAKTILCYENQKCYSCENGIPNQRFKLTD